MKRILLASAVMAGALAMVPATADARGGFGGGGFRGGGGVSTVVAVVSVAAGSRAEAAVLSPAVAMLAAASWVDTGAVVVAITGVA